MHPGALKDLRLCLKYFLLASQPVKVTNEGWILLIGEWEGGAALEEGGLHKTCAASPRSSMDQAWISTIDHGSAQSGSAPWRRSAFGHDHAGRSLTLTVH